MTACDDGENAVSVLFADEVDEACNTIGAGCVKDEILISSVMLPLG